MATQIVINDNVSNRHIPAPTTVLVSSDANNALRSGSDGNLYVPKGEEQNLVSQQAGNYIRYGSDKGVFLDGNDVLSNGRANLLHTSERDGKVELLEDDLKDLKLGGPSSDRDNLLDAGDDGKAMLQPKVINHMVDDKVDPLKDDVADAKKKAEEALDATKHLVVDVVSKDRKNVITEGSDKGAYLSADDIVDIVEDAGITKVDVRDLINPGTDPLLTTQGDKLVSSLQVQYNEATGRLDILGVHGNSIAHTQIPTAVALLKSVNLEDNPAGQPAGTYIHFVFELTDRTESHVYLNVNKLAQFYTAGEGIKIAEDGTVSVDRAFVEGVVEDTVDEELKEGGAIKDAIDDAVDEAVKDITVVSGDAGNIIKTGTDKGAKLTNDDIAAAMNDALYTGAVSVVSGSAGNLLTKGPDNGAFLDKNSIPAVGPSTDAGNALSEGSDGKLYYKPVTDYGELA